MNNLTQIIIALLDFKGIGPKAIIAFLGEIKISNETIIYQELCKTNITAIKSAINKQMLTPLTWEQALKKAKNTIIESDSKKIKILNFYDAHYPKKFKNLKNYPILIYAKGNIDLLNYEKSVAIIGTRNPSEFGVKMGVRVSKLLAKSNYVIVSGLAKGIDTCAHMGALEGAGKTIAVLAHGLEIPVYPKENRKLAEEILEFGGLLLSTYPNATKLMPQFLAARDEWQSGLSDGIIVVETGIKGGTNITIGHALKQNRPVAVIDHRQFKNGELAFIKQAEGNIKYISEKKAYPLYTEKSIREFENKLKESRKKIVQNQFDTNENQKKTENSQIELL